MKSLPEGQPVRTTQMFVMLVTEIGAVLIGVLFAVGSFVLFVMDRRPDPLEIMCLIGLGTLGGCFTLLGGLAWSARRAAGDLEGRVAQLERRLTEQGQPSTPG